MIISPANSTPLKGVPRAAMPRTVGQMISSIVRRVISGVITGRRRIGAHAAGVGALLAVEDALVVLGGGQRQRVRAVDQGEEARLLADQALLDHHLGAGRAERAREAGLDGGGGILARLGDDHALAGRQAVGLDDDRQRLRRRDRRAPSLVSLKRP